MKARLKKEDLIVVTEDHGGYQGGRCIVCKESGWIDYIDHKSWCPIQPGRSLTHVEIKEVE